MNLIVNSFYLVYVTFFHFVEGSSTLSIEVTINVLLSARKLFAVMEEKHDILCLILHLLYNSESLDEMNLTTHYWFSRKEVTGPNGLSFRYTPIELVKH